MHIAGTEPYPWPFDGRIAGGHLALVLAGWDESWLARCLHTEAVGSRCLALADAVRTAGGLVVGIAHQGAVPLPVPAGGTAVTADGLDGLFGGPLDGALRRTGSSHLLVGGFGLEGPVHSTLRSANDRGFECLLLTDASAPLTTTLGEAAAKTVTMSGGIFGAIGSAAGAIDALTSTFSPTLKESPS